MDKKVDSPSPPQSESGPIDASPLRVIPGGRESLTPSQEAERKALLARREHLKDAEKRDLRRRESLKTKPKREDIPTVELDYARKEPEEKGMARRLKIRLAERRAENTAVDDLAKGTSADLVGITPFVKDRDERNAEQARVRSVLMASEPDDEDPEPDLPPAS